MANSARRSCLRGALLVGSLFCALSEAQIATDGTVGPARNLAGPNFQIGADLGATRGANLFHSFRTFNIANGETATFTGPANIANVISRVTGGDVSSIDGLLRSQVGRADFYFINPAGVVFGPNAKIDVPAAFHVGTADMVRFSDGSVFSAANADGSSLTVAQPESFGFLSPQPASLTVNGSRLEFATASRVSMIAGDVAIQDGASVRVAGGDVHVTAVGDAGTAVDLATGTAESSLAGAIAIRNATVDVSGVQAGQVALRGKNIEAASAVVAGDHGGSDAAGGRLLLEADNVRVIDSEIRARVFGAGRGNDIVVVAEDLEVDATTASDGRSRLMTRVMPGAGGGAGDIWVEAARVTLSNGGQLQSIVLDGGSGPGGTVTVKATDSVVIEGSNAASFFSGIDTITQANTPGGNIAINSPTASVRITRGGFLQSGTAGAGSAGDIKVAAHDLEIAEDAVIDSRTFGSGKAGAIQIDATGAVTVAGGAVTADTEGAGDAGSITIAARAIELHRGQLTANTSNIGAAGEIRLRAGNSVVLTNDSGIQAYSDRPSTDSRLGDAGHVSISTPFLSMVDSSIDVFSFSRANAGSIEVMADQMHVDNTAPGTMTAFNASNFGGSSLPFGSRLVTGEEARSGTILLDAARITFDHGARIAINTSAGDGGAVIVRTDELSLLNGAGISGITTGPGRGGDVRINVTGTFLIEGSIATSPLASDLPGSRSETGPAGAISITAGALIVGHDGEILSDSFSNAPAGPITLEVRTLEVRDGGQISSSAGAQGPGANIVITALDAVRVHGVDPDLPSDPSEILADAAFSAGGRGGSIRIETPLLLLERGGILSSETGGRGASGAIDIVADNLVIRSGGEISTSTFGAGQAGTIQISANSVSINQEGNESLNPLLRETGLFSRTLPDATGDAGAISVTAGSAMELLSGAQISTSTSKAGNAGTITINAGELLIGGGVPGRAVSAIASRADRNATGTVGTVRVNADSLIINGGEISIAAHQTLPEDRLSPGSEGLIRVDGRAVRLDRGARITAQSTGNVPASAIDVHANELRMTGGSTISTSSNDADGGPIRVDGRRLWLQDSLFTTSVAGATGNGGNIDVNADVLVLETGFIQANTAAARASGGDVTINVGTLIPSGGTLFVGGDTPIAFRPGVVGLNVIQAAAPEGVSGALQVTTPESELAARLSNLPAAIVDTSALARDPCRIGAGSSFTPTGRGGLPPSSVDLLRPETRSSFEERRFEALQGHGCPCHADCRPALGNKPSEDPLPSAWVRRQDGARRGASQ